MRMLLPLWRMGGLFCSSCTCGFWSPKNQLLLEWILAWMETEPEEPLRTVMSPERVSTSRSTGPLTWKERSKVPMTEAKPANEPIMTKTSVRTAGWRNTQYLFIAKRLHGCHFGCPLRRVHSGGERDQRKSKDRNYYRNYGDDRMRHEIREGQLAKCDAGAEAEGESEAAAGHGQQRGFGKELPQNVAAGCTDSLPHTDFACAFGDRDEHDVHHADSAQTERNDGDAAEKQCDHPENIFQQLGAFHRVPDEERIFVGGIEVVHAAEHAADLLDGVIVGLRVGDLEDEVIEIALHNAGFLRRWKIPGHRGVGREQVVVVGPTVVGILLFLLENSHHGIGNAFDRDHGTDRRLSTEQLLPRSRTEYHYAATLALVFVGDEAARLQF